MKHVQIKFKELPNLPYKLAFGEVIKLNSIYFGTIDGNGTLCINFGVCKFYAVKQHNIHVILYEM